MKQSHQSLKNQFEVEFRALSCDERAIKSQRFFKTGKGDYGEGDIFLGISMPEIRARITRYTKMPLNQILKILASKYHEERMFALLLLVKKFEKGDEKQREQIYKAYLANTSYINNWDLVDSSSHYIVGKYLLGRNKKVLFGLAKSDDVWERRIAILATFYFIKNSQYETSLEIAKVLLADTHDLIHKAVGWMLREVGNRDRAIEQEFLDLHYQKMPRTMLRYAIEKFSPSLRQQYLKGKRSIG